MNCENIPSLNDIDRDSCEGPLTEIECFSALESFKKNKSPGNDGLTYEIYEKFWKILKKPFLDSFDESYRRNELSTSQRQAVITLIDKKNKDRQYLKNWRPISLLNCDYKIASKAIAFRLRKVISSLIHTDQSGFVNKRNISFTLRTVLDILELADRDKIDGILMLIDFEKAFNTVNHNFTISVLNKFNFGLSFVNWVKTFYNHVTSCVMNNQTTSKYFEIKRGVRQGDPLSPYLFILVTEILAINIREHNEIKGIRIGNNEIKLTQYADDTTAIIQDQNSAKLFLEITKDFSKCSGLKINFDKTEGLWIGDNKGKVETPLGITWPKEPIKLLGLYIGYNKKDIVVSNFRHKIIKMKQILTSWKQRDLTLIGKILIMKTLVTSLFRYLAKVIIFPKETIDEIQTCMYEFLWNSKTHKVKKNVVIQDY